MLSRSVIPRFQRVYLRGTHSIFNPLDLFHTTEVSHHLRYYLKTFYMYRQSPSSQAAVCPTSPQRYCKRFSSNVCPRPCELTEHQNFRGTSAMSVPGGEPYSFPCGRRSGIESRSKMTVLTFGVTTTMSKTRKIYTTSISTRP